ncbi:MAG: response regulator receiver domain protein (CheY-like) [Rickettsiaceae bacterium]|nr:response regulator receiver domain protein (CheY-like) [Rickettsiaceae bacterium]
MLEKSTPRRLTILIIEDNQMFRSLAKEMLSGNNIIQAEDGHQGMNLYYTYKPDITFLDIGLPDQSGHGVLEKIMQANPQAFVVMLTASNLQKDVEEALKKGAKGYIIKPFSRKKIKDILDQFFATIL